MNFSRDKQLEMRKTQIASELTINSCLQVNKTRQKLNELLDCADEELSGVKSRKARTLLETTIALVRGLIKAFEHYETSVKQKRRGKFFKLVN